MNDGYPYDAHRRVKSLRRSMRDLVQRDPEQEVQGIAIPVLSASLEAIKEARPEDPVVQSLVELFSADYIGSGESVRAADVLVVVDQLDAALGEPPPPTVEVLNLDNFD